MRKTAKRLFGALEQVKHRGGNARKMTPSRSQVPSAIKAPGPLLRIKRRKPFSQTSIWGKESQTDGHRLGSFGENQHGVTDGAAHLKNVMGLSGSFQHCESTGFFIGVHKGLLQRRCSQKRLPRFQDLFQNILMLSYPIHTLQ
ncbi:hypothetical protein GWK47_019520 [Chionoecetes opilio]|uniref:Uncharacterized protein n=1 Tax=Chionoecetes opilio TaxID=41210 RepID=A0A8J4XQF8_CHIOP|nr:hypothetical protein GWK47_019520 [Chionoecetes opilio]